MIVPESWSTVWWGGALLGLGMAIWLVQRAIGDDPVPTWRAWGRLRWVPVWFGLLQILTYAPGLLGVPAWLRLAADLVGWACGSVAISALGLNIVLGMVKLARRLLGGAGDGGGPGLLQS